jgi:hypothetical protein
MRYIKILASLALPLLLVSMLWSQDLNEAAKKEKERREAVKGKKAMVVTNTDLGAVKKKPNLADEGAGATVEPEEASAEQAQPAEGSTPDETSNPAGQAAAGVDQVEPETAGEPLQVVPEVNTEPQATATPAQKPTRDMQQSNLESQWLKAKEYADLLELKINGLWQDFYNMDDMSPKDLIQQTIAETFDKYQLAREAEAKAKEALDKFLGGTKKD